MRDLRLVRFKEVIICGVGRRPRNRYTKDHKHFKELKVERYNGSLEDEDEGSNLQLGSFGRDLSVPE